MNLWILVVVCSLSGVRSLWTRDCSDISCIRNSEDLKANYKCDRLSVAGGHNLFLRYNLGSARSDIQAVYYNISIGNTNYTSKLESSFTNKCCNPSDKYCKVYFVYSSVIFFNIHPMMLYYLTFFHWPRTEDIFNYPQFCWSPSTFCDKDDAENILWDFTSEVFAAEHGDLQDISSMSNYYIVLADSSLTPKRLLRSERRAIYIIPVLSFVVTGLTVMLYINMKMRSIREILIHSSMARCSVRSLMIVLWMGTILYLVQYYRTISYFDQNIDTNPISHAYKDFFKLQAIIGYVHFAIFLTVFLLETPFLCSAIYKINEPSKMNYRYQKKKYTIFKVMITTFGHMGIVFFIQTLTVSMFYLAVFMFVAPLHGIILLSRGILLIAIIFCVLTLFQVMLLEKRKCVCSCTPIVKVLIVVMAGTTACYVLGFWGSVFRHIKNSETETTFKMDDIVHSIASSILLGGLGYICKKVIYQRVKKEMDTARSDSERQPLISM